MTNFRWKIVNSFTVSASERNDEISFKDTIGLSDNKTSNTDFFQGIHSDLYDAHSSYSKTRWQVSMLSHKRKDIFASLLWYITNTYLSKLKLYETKKNTRFQIHHSTK